MALGPRLDLRQSQSLVMTPQLQQAIKLLALSNLEIEAFIGEALDTNPLLEAGELRHESPAEPDGREEAPEDPSADQLILRGQGEADAPLDIDPAALDRDRDTGDQPLPNTERLTDRTLILPVFHQMTDAEQDRVVDALQEAGG